MKNTKTFLIAAAFAAVACAPDFTRYVNPFIGTDELGHCHPCACVPFGNTQVGPQTNNCGWHYSGGYLYADTLIQGFIHNAINGTGVPDLGDVLMFPFCKETSGYVSRFEKDSETATPGYYSVFLTDAGVAASMSATEHAAIHSFVYEDPGNARLMIDFQNGLVKEDWLLPVHIKESCQNVEDSYKISGWARNNVWVDRYYYYAIEFNHPIVGRTILPLRDDREKAPRWVLEFDMQGDESLMAKISVSSRSIEGAWHNIDSEIPGWNLDRVHRKAVRKWNEKLGRVNIEASEEGKGIFYTTMYHLFTQPNNIRDHGGKPLYSTLSLWDTFRAAHPLYTILAPEYVGDFVESMLELRDSLGYLPVWNLWGKDNFCMIGSHSVPVIVDACMKGFDGFDVERAYEAVKRSLTIPMPKADFYVYDKYGYFPYDFVPKESVSRTLECCYDDWCAAQLASSLGKEDDAAFFKKRSEYWKNLFDTGTGLMRGRDSEGNWRTPFRPLYISHEASAGGDYTEGNAWQYSWHVMHDVPTLIEMMGGKEAFCRKLDSLFILEDKGIKSEMYGAFGRQIGQYLHGNEPSHHIPYLYTLAGRQDKTARAVKEIYDTQYRNALEGFCGNDDCGQMSAWYIFSTLGFYPVNPCGGDYVLGCPQVERAVVKLAGGKHLTVIAKGVGKGCETVRRVILNGKEITGGVIRHADIMRGGTLEFEMESPYYFDGYMSASVLDRYLDRAITMSEFLVPEGLSRDGAYPDWEADLELIRNTGAKFIGRAIYRWGGEEDLNDPEFLSGIAEKADRLHSVDPEAILQAAVFEAIYKKGVDRVKIPSWVFDAFSLPVEDRCFSYDRMLFPEGIGVNIWGEGGSVPDIRQMETQMWFLFLITTYVAAGCEAIHFGQTYWIGHEDREEWAVFDNFLQRVRSFASRRARRHFVLFDSHAYADGMMVGDRSLLDFISFPLRPKADTSRHMAAVLEAGYSDAVYGKTKSAVVPSGWKCEHMPYLVEFDNYGVTAHPGEHVDGEIFTWGYDEISWFYSLDKSGKEAFLKYAWNWIKATDPVGHLEMPGRRGVMLRRDPVDFRVARAVAPSENVPDGMGIEGVIKSLWEE